MAALTFDAVVTRSKADSAENVRSLQCWAMKLSDVSILPQFKNLEVLNLSCNNITSLQPIGQCKNLSQLYLRKNNIFRFEELDHLKDLRNLQSVWLSGNPISSIENYRLKVLSILPQIERLDEEIVTEEERKVCSSSVMKFIEEEQGNKVAVDYNQQQILKAVFSLLPLLSHSNLARLHEAVQNRIRELSANSNTDEE
ncbi:PREDICTED: protein C21orf2-like [Amphimedon queenslandica]|uniref:U2A'/phosphoprotein 32 family A C-terminal domain-containing protein n=1 Tax=Amphimedon queenslandica TaxID=400682 RepID=A0A1X7VMM5_AMPQE|nr:PREDICTED: protein C21orf2-like [Amphimedon queenslandica]|eukprot:XP_003383891.1 PREDICTED: protein C21orf2-like [Amphimedon queenslandica]